MESELKVISDFYDGGMEPYPRLPVDASQPLVSNWRRWIASATGVMLCLLFIAWWCASIRADHLWLGKRTWIPAWPTLGRDFSHNFLAVHSIRDGVNPYLHYFGDDRGPYSYPPLVLLEFAWCALIPRSAFALANAMWVCAVAGIVAVAALASIASRQRWSGTRTSRLFISAIVLCSTPVVFAMERGNCDAIVLGMILASASLMRRNSKWCDAVAGLCLAVAMWTKIYPGLLVLGLIPLRRWTTLMWAIVGGVVIPLIFLSNTRDFFHTSSVSEGYRTEFFRSALAFSKDPAAARTSAQHNYPAIETDGHSLPIYWQKFWTDVNLPRIARIPGIVGTAFILAPLLAWIAPRLRGADDLALIYPYLLWLALLATFWMPVSYDYNLIYWPVLAVAIWRWRDGPLAHFLILPSLLYWQPIGLNIPSPILLLFKLMMLFGLTLSLSKRIGDARRVTEATPLVM